MLREWENQRYLPPREWTKDQWETYRWLTSIEHDQRKHARREYGAIILQLEKEQPARGEVLMKVIVWNAQSPDQAQDQLGPIFIDPAGDIARGSELVSLLMSRRNSDPLHPPDSRALP